MIGQYVVSRIAGGLVLALAGGVEADVVVVACTAGDIIEAAAADEVIVAFAADERVGPLVADDVIIAGGAASWHPQPTRPPHQINVEKDLH